MRKKLDTTGVMNELRGQSVFFPTASKANEKEQSNTSLSQEESTQEQKAEKERMVSRHQDTMIPRYQPINQDTEVSQNEEDIIETVRRSVKRIGKEAATHRCTLEERQALDDIEYQYKRQGIRTSSNEITRIAVNYIVEDYRKNGDNSILAQVLEKLNS